MLININDVKVTNRIRKDFGDIEELADDIRDNGLINPPVVTPDYELIAGERRLRAMKELGYHQIEVRIMSVKDAEHQLQLEINENEVRKDFSKKERLEYARRLERIEKVKADKIRISNLNNQNIECETLPIRKQGRTSDIVASKLGIGSGKQYDREKYIAENADSETLDLWDKGDISTNKAYLKIKEDKENAEKKIKELEDKNSDLEKKNKEFSSIQSDLSKAREDRHKLNAELEKLRNNQSTEVVIEKVDTDETLERLAKLESEISNKEKLIKEYTTALREKEEVINQSSSMPVNQVPSNTGADVVDKMRTFLEEVAKYEATLESFDDIPEDVIDEYEKYARLIYNWCNAIIGDNTDKDEDDEDEDEDIDWVKELDDIQKADDEMFLEFMKNRGMETEEEKERKEKEKKEFDPTDPAGLNKIFEEAEKREYPFDMNENLRILQQSNGLRKDEVLTRARYGHIR